MDVSGKGVAVAAPEREVVKAKVRGVSVAEADDDGEDEKNEQSSGGENEDEAEDGEQDQEEEDGSGLLSELHSQDWLHWFLLLTASSFLHMIAACSRRARRFRLSMPDLVRPVRTLELLSLCLAFSGVFMY